MHNVARARIEIHIHIFLYTEKNPKSTLDFAIILAMSEIARRVDIPGLVEGGVSCPKVNPSGQSVPIIFNEEKVLIVRPIGDNPLLDTKMNAESEITRRREAVEIHKKYMPNYTQENDFVILQGYVDKNKPVQILARMVDYYTDVSSISNMTKEEILGNEDLCRDLVEINLAYMKMVLNEGVIPDRGMPGNFLKRIPVISRITKKLTDSNIMVGFDPKGYQKVFCDPDWFHYEEELSDLGIKFPKVGSILNYGTRIVVFGIAAYCHKLRKTF